MSIEQPPPSPSPHARALLDQYRQSKVMDAGRKEQIWGALQADIAAGVAAAELALSQGSSSATAGTGGGWWAALGKVSTGTKVLVGSVAVALGGGAVALSLSGEGALVNAEDSNGQSEKSESALIVASETTHKESPELRPEASNVGPLGTAPVLTLSPQNASKGGDSPTRVRSKKRVRHSANSGRALPVIDHADANVADEQTSEKHPNSLSEERSLLRSIRKALKKENTKLAAALIQRYPRDFGKDGLLLEEYSVLRIQLSCARGERDKAEREAKSFLKRFPGSPHSASLSKLCE